MTETEEDNLLYELGLDAEWMRFKSRYVDGRPDLEELAPILEATFKYSFNSGMLCALKDIQAKARKNRC